MVPSNELQSFNESFLAELVSYEFRQTKLPSNFKAVGLWNGVQNDNPFAAAVYLNIGAGSGYLSYGIHGMFLGFTVKREKVKIHVFLMNHDLQKWQMINESPFFNIGHPLYSYGTNFNGQEFIISKDTLDCCMNSLIKHLKRGDQIFHIDYLHSMSKFTSLNFENYQKMISDMNKSTFIAYKDHIHRAMIKVMRSLTSPMIV
tara:strand:- start:720 stop:1325 length:606 start_codon:yes stop_codon:yes gene_type:complete